MRLAIAVLFVLACGSAAQPTTMPLPTATVATKPAPTLDACQRALAASGQRAELPLEIVLVSAPGADAEAAPYDAWLGAVVSSQPAGIRYQWVVVDDDASRRFARRGGLLDARAGVVLETGVALDVVVLDGAPDSSKLAAIVRKAQEMTKSAGEEARDCRVPTATSPERKPGRLAMPHKALVAKGELARATTLRIDEPGRRTELERAGATWKLRTASGAFDADEENVQHALENLEEVEVFEPLAKDTSHDALLGLSPELATHVVVSAGSETLVDLAFGRAGARGAAVRVAGEPDARVAAGLSEFRFQRESRFWRNRAIWNFDASAVERIEIESQHRWVFTRERGAWRATLEGRPFTPLDERGVDLLVSAFRKLSAEDFADAATPTGLDKTARVIRFVVHGQKKVLRVGAARAAGGFFAQADGDPNVYVIGGYPSAWVNGAEPERFRPRP